MRSNIDKTRRSLESHPDVSQVHLDAAPGEGEAFIRCMVDDYELSEDLESLVSSLENISISRSKWVGFAREVILR